MEKGQTKHHNTNVRRSAIEIPSTLGMSARNTEIGPSHSCHLWCCGILQGTKLESLTYLCHANIHLNYSHNADSNRDIKLIGMFFSLTVFVVLSNFYLKAIWELAERRKLVSFSPFHIPQAPNSEFVGKNTTEISHFEKSVFRRPVTKVYSYFIS